MDQHQTQQCHVVQSAAATPTQVDSETLDHLKS